MILIVVGLVIAYLLGSIPSAIWIGKSFFNKDVREHGSGNAGATNTFRVLGWKPGVIVFIIDTIKGFFAVYIMGLLSTSMPEYTTLVSIVAGLMAVIGHIYPVFAQFRGGKGVATMLGIILGIHPAAALLSLAVFAVTFLITQYVSAGSMMAALSFPIFVFFVFHPDDVYLRIFSLLLATILFYSHRTNISRLIKGTESKIRLYGKK
ncbi:MAG: glycerol-3-phosphate 1-O-acyltransferase PlsY [Salinivirgaceae bacterium]|jgi:glycerol-3-phosphate acyltransferase PlsY|nr:glycerol-3-phosphate 1-O-acyltransferase PlsY [Salinivirgaceae bacterium]